VTWNGIISSGGGWFSYRGECADNAPHAHAALQVAVARSGSIAVCASTSGRVEGRSILVRSSIRHRLEPSLDVFLVLFEPASPLACFLDETAPPGDVVILEDKVTDLLRADENGETNLSALISKASGFPPPQIDARLAKALRLVGAIEGPQPVAHAAAAVGLSTARLRALAKQELGWPLSDWFAWRRLEKAVSSMKAGDGLAIAAADAGFADQAHMSKAMRRLLGITPGTLGSILANS
jgi:AraC-like DNA-binding protein